MKVLKESEATWKKEDKNKFFKLETEKNKIKKEYFQEDRLGGYLDLPQTKNDEIVAIAGLKKLGFLDKNITKLREPTFSEVEKAIYSTMIKINKNKEKAKNTFLFVYFAGHGQLRGGLQVGVLNEKKVINLEKYLRTFA